MSNTEQFSQDEIDQQQTLLATHRRTLVHLLQQAAQYGGEVSAPPSVSNGIHEARANIRHIKATLHGYGVPITEHPDDEPAASQSPASLAFQPPDATRQKVGIQDNVKTGGGDYPDGGIDKRQGVFISGGAIYGTVVGSNTGTITTTYDAPLTGSSPNGSLEQITSHTQQAAAQARQRGDEEIAEDLDGVIHTLQAALKAQREGKTDRRTAKLREAQAALRRVVEAHPQLHEVMRVLEQAV